MRVRTTVALWGWRSRLVAVAVSAFGICCNVSGETAATVKADVVAPGDGTPQDVLSPCLRQYGALRPTPNGLGNFVIGANGKTIGQPSRRPAPAVTVEPIPTHWDARPMLIPTQCDVEVVMIGGKEYGGRGGGCHLSPLVSPLLVNRAPLDTTPRVAPPFSPR